MLNKALTFIMASRTNALLVAAVLALLGPLVWLSQAIIALVTLRNGPLEGLYAMAVTSIVASVSAYFWLSPSMLPNVILSTLLAWGAAFVLYKTMSWSWVFTIGVIVSVIGVIAIHQYMPNIIDVWRQIFTELFANLNDMMGNEVVLDSQNYVEPISRIATGIVISSLFLKVILQLLLARYSQALLYNPGGFREEMDSTKLHNALTFVLIVAVLLTYADMGIVLDLLPVLVLPFLVLGIFYVHRFCRNRKTGTFFLVFFYITLAFFPLVIAIPAVLVMIDGLKNVLNIKR